MHARLRLRRKQLARGGALRGTTRIHTWRRAATWLAILFTVLSVASWALAQSNPVAGTAAADTAETHVGRGYDYLKQDRYDAAVTEFRAALALDPTLVLRAQFPLAVALFELRQPQEARKQFEAVRREAGDHPNILYYLGRLDLEDRDFDSAIRNLRAAAAKPPFPDTSYYLGFAYFKHGDFTAAEQWLKEAAEANPRDARIPYQLGLVYRQQGLEDQSQKAFSLSDELHTQDDREGRLRVECGQKLDQGPREQAHALCDHLYDPDNAEKLMTLGTIYAQHGDLDASLKPLRRAAELEPHSPQMQYNLALAYYQLNRFEDARAPMAGAVKRWPDLFQLNALYGAILFKLDQEASAYPVLHHAHQLNPDDAGTRDMLYDTAMRLARKDRAAKRYSDSLRYLEEASNLRPQEPEPHRRKASVYKLTARAAQASAEQKKAERLAQTQPQ